MLKISLTEQLLEKIVFQSELCAIVNWEGPEHLSTQNCLVWTGPSEHLSTQNWVPSVNWEASEHYTKQADTLWQSALFSTLRSYKDTLQQPWHPLLYHLTKGEDRGWAGLQSDSPLINSVELCRPVLRRLETCTNRQKSSCVSLLTWHNTQPLTCRQSPSLSYIPLNISQNIKLQLTKTCKLCKNATETVGFANKWRIIA